jgi:hypothetical protein
MVMGALPTRRSRRTGLFLANLPCRGQRISTRRSGGFRGTMIIPALLDHVPNSMRRSVTKVVVSRACSVPRAGALTGWGPNRGCAGGGQRHEPGLWFAKLLSVAIFSLDKCFQGVTPLRILFAKGELQWPFSATPGYPRQIRT